MAAHSKPQDSSELAPGWTAARKLQFLDHLAQKGNVRAACRRVGLSREAAYRLRRRHEEFARGWAAAMVLAHDVGKAVLATCAIDGIEEQIWYRGELVGTRRRFDTRLLLAHLARLDAVAAKPEAQRDAGHFDELLAVIAGERAPDDLLEEDEDILPIERETAAERAAYAAELAPGGQDVDDAIAEGGAEFSPRTVSDVSTTALAAGLAARSAPSTAIEGSTAAGARPG